MVECACPAWAGQKGGSDDIVDKLERDDDYDENLCEALMACARGVVASCASSKLAHVCVSAMRAYQAEDAENADFEDVGYIWPWSVHNWEKTPEKQKAPRDGRLGRSHGTECTRHGIQVYKVGVVASGEIANTSEEGSSDEPVHKRLKTATSLGKPKAWHDFDEGEAKLRATPSIESTIVVGQHLAFVCEVIFANIIYGAELHNAHLHNLSYTLAMRIISFFPKDGAYTGVLQAHRVGRGHIPQLAPEPTSSHFVGWGREGCDPTPNRLILRCGVSLCLFLPLSLP